MHFNEPYRPTVEIGVFAAQEGWLLTHPAVQSRFEDREDAVAAAKRLAHLEIWRGRQVEILVQEPDCLRLTPLQGRA